MLIDTANAKEAADLSATRTLILKAGQVATRKIWLPRFIYEVLPYFYLTAGFAAFFATLYISDWYWVLPHYLLFSVGCVHLAAVVLRRRRSHRSGHAARSGPDSDRNA